MFILLISSLPNQTITFSYGAGGSEKGRNPASPRRSKPSIAIVAGVVVGSAVVGILISGLCLWRRQKRQRFLRFGPFGAQSKGGDSSELCDVSITHAGFSSMRMDFRTDNCVSSEVNGTEID